MAQPPSSDSATSSQNAIIATRQKKKKCVMVVLTRKQNSHEIIRKVVLGARGIDVTDFPMGSHELKLVGVGVDWMDLLKRLKKKLGDAEICSLAELNHHNDDDDFPGNCTIL